MPDNIELGSQHEACTEKKYGEQCRAQNVASGARERAYGCHVKIRYSLDLWNPVNFSLNKDASQ